MGERLPEALCHVVTVERDKFEHRGLFEQEQAAELGAARAVREPSEGRRVGDDSTQLISKHDLIVVQQPCYSPLSCETVVFPPPSPARKSAARPPTTTPDAWTMTAE